MKNILIDKKAILNVLIKHNKRQSKIKNSHVLNSYFWRICH